MLENSVQTAGPTPTPKGAAEPRPDPAVLLADLPSMVHDVLRIRLARNRLRLEVAPSRDSAEASLARGGVSMVLLGPAMQDVTALTFLKVLRSTPHTMTMPVIMLGRGGEMEAVLSLDAGADDYVPVPASAGELVMRIMAVRRRCSPRAGATLPRSIRTVGPIELDEAARRVRVDGQPVGLRAAELAILAKLMSAPERVFTRPQLTDSAQAKAEPATERVADVHIRRLRSQLQPHGVAHLIETVRGLGYRIVHPHPHPDALDA